MSLKMTDFSFVSCFVSCFDNTGYRSCVPPISAAGSQNKKKWGSWQRHWLKNILKGEHILQFSWTKDLAMEWKWKITSVLAASSLHHILGVIQLNCLPDASYTALFIGKLWIPTLYCSMSIAIHFCCVPFPKLGNEPCDFCRYVI